MITIDTNIVISYVYENDNSLDAYIQNQLVIVPHFQKIEVINVLRKAHYFYGTQIDKVDFCYDAFENIIDEFVEDQLVLTRARNLSFELNHPIYDCLYLAVCIERESAFLSKDKRLLVKAQSIGIETITF